MIQTIKNSKLIIPVLSGFLAIIIIVLFLWFTNINQVKEQYNIIQSNKLAAQKMHIIAKLIEIARKRTRLTSYMFITDDAFEKDDIKMELNALATQFAMLRNQLLNLPLNSFEKDIINKQNKIIVLALSEQRRIAEIAIINDPEEIKKGQHLLQTQVFPRQGEIIDFFMMILTRLEENISSTSKHAETTLIQYQRLTYILLFIFLLLFLLITIYTLRKSIQIEKKLEIEKYIAKVTLMSIGDAVIITNNNSQIIDINNTTQKIFDLSYSDTVNSHIHNKISIQFDNKKLDLKYYLDKAISDGGIQIINETTYVHSSIKNERCYVDILLSPINDSKKIIGCIITLRDVTEKIKRHKKLEHQAKYDSLTSLLNRHAFEEEFQSHYNKLSEYNSFSLCILDLDHFKIINDTCGHKSGDKVLIDVAKILESCLRKNDIVARIGGDEFAVIIAGCYIQQAEKLLKQFLAKLERYQHQCDGQKFAVGCSIGVTEVSLSILSYADAMHQADKACYRAKADGRNQLKLSILENE